MCSTNPHSVLKSFPVPHPQFLNYDHKSGEARMRGYNGKEIIQKFYIQIFPLISQVQIGTLTNLGVFGTHSV